MSKRIKVGHITFLILVLATAMVFYLSGNREKNFHDQATVTGYQMSVQPRSLCHDIPHDAAGPVDCWTSRDFRVVVDV